MRPPRHAWILLGPPLAWTFQPLQAKLDALLQRLLQVQPAGQFRHRELKAVVHKIFVLHPDLQILTDKTRWRGGAVLLIHASPNLT